MARKIAMVGTAGSGVKAPFNDSRYEIWGVSSRGRHVTRATRWFELHNLHGEPQDWSDQWRAVLRSSMVGTPIYMIYPEPDLGDVVVFPANKMIDRFGTFFMSSTFSWMMALAIDEMAPEGKFAEPGSEIAIFGVDMEAGTEWAEQRHGFRHFMLLAKALGIRVTRLTATGLSYEPVPYPMIQDDPMLAKLALRYDEAVAQLNALNESLATVQATMARDRACVSLLGEIMAAEASNGEVVFDRAKRLVGFQEDEIALTRMSQRMSKDIVTLESQLAELEFWRSYLRA